MRPPAPNLSRRMALAGAGSLLGACATMGGRTDGRRLEAVLDLAMADRSTSILVRRDGRTLGERHAPGWGAERPREVASVAKSMVAVLIAMAVQDGAIDSLDQSAAAFIPGWRDDPRAAVTLRHLMSMTSGLDDAGLALRGVTGDQFALNAAAPLKTAPGARWAYNTAAYHLLFHVLVRATGQTVEAYAEQRLLGPLGMGRTRWITSEGRGAAGPVTNYYSAESTAGDLARFGELVLDGGVWNGRRLIEKQALEALLAPSQALNPSYGLLWWANARPGMDAYGRGPAYRFPSAPRDTVAALGAGGQAVLVVPSRGLIVVRQGDAPASANLGDALLGGVLAAIGEG